jgi:hypothetical protein
MMTLADLQSLRGGPIDERIRQAGNTAERVWRRHNGEFEIEISLFPQWEQIASGLPQARVLLYGLAHG